MSKLKTLSTWELSEKDTRVRIGIAKNVFTKPILTGGLKQATKKKLVKTLVWSVVTYAAETWTINKTRKDWKLWKCWSGGR